MPRIFVFFISKSPILLPRVATGTRIFSLTLGAPQTICNKSLPVSTSHKFNLSALGCFVQLLTFPTITFESIELIFDEVHSRPN